MPLVDVPFGAHITRSIEQAGGEPPEPAGERTGFQPAECGLQSFLFVIKGVARLGEPEENAGEEERPGCVLLEFDFLACSYGFIGQVVPGVGDPPQNIRPSGSRHKPKKTSSMGTPEETAFQ